MRAQNGFQSQQPPNILIAQPLAQLAYHAAHLPMLLSSCLCLQRPAQTVAVGHTTRALFISLQATCAVQCGTALHTCIIPYRHAQEYCLRTSLSRTPYRKPQHKFGHIIYAYTGTETSEASVAEALPRTHFHLPGPPGATCRKLRYRTHAAVLYGLPGSMVQ